MPLTLTLTTRPAQPLRLAAQRRPPFWRRLLALADRALPSLTLFWQTVFTDAQAALDLDVLAQQLRTSSTFLPADQLIRDTWQQAVEAPGRQLLPLLLQDPVRDAGQASVEKVRAGLDLPGGVFAVLPDVHQALDTYVGLQLAVIGATTLRTVRQVLRAGWQAQQEPSALAGAVLLTLGLTPRQGQALRRLQARVVAEGRSARQVARAVAQAGRLGRHQRAQRIAQTESVAAVNLGAQQGLEQQVRWGVVEETQVRRRWITAGEAPCPAICLPIPGMNPEGVGMRELFQTPSGPVFLPPMHPR